MIKATGNVDPMLPRAVTPVQSDAVTGFVRYVVVDPRFKQDFFLQDTSDVLVTCGFKSQMPNRIVKAFSKVEDVASALRDMAKVEPREYSMSDTWLLRWQWPPIQHDVPADWSELKGVAISDMTATQLRLILHDPLGDKLRVSPSGGCSWFIHRDIDTLSQATAVLYTAATAMRSAIDGMWVVEPLSGQCYPVGSDACNIHKMQTEIGGLADAVNVVKNSVEAEEREFRSHLITILVFGGGAFTGLFFGLKGIYRYWQNRTPSAVHQVMTVLRVHPAYQGLSGAELKSSAEYFLREWRGLPMIERGGSTTVPPADWLVNRIAQLAETALGKNKSPHSAEDRPDREAEKEIKGKK